MEIRSKNRVRNRAIFVKIIRLLKVYYIKIIRSNGTPHGIAMAVALGLFVGCIFPMGTQTLPAILLAFILRVDKLLAFIATWITNPYTVPFIYPLFCYTGAKILGSSLTFSRIEKDLLEISQSFSWHALKKLGIELGASFFVGALFYGIIVSIAGYFAVRLVITKYRKRKKRLRLARL